MADALVFAARIRKNISLLAKRKTPAEKAQKLFWSKFDLPVPKAEPVKKQEIARMNKENFERLQSLLLDKNSRAHALKYMEKNAGRFHQKDVRGLLEHTLHGCWEKDPAFARKCLMASANMLEGKNLIIFTHEWANKGWDDSRVAYFDAANSKLGICKWTVIGRYDKFVVEERQGKNTRLGILPLIRRSIASTGSSLILYDKTMHIHVEDVAGLRKKIKASIKEEFSNITDMGETTRRGMAAWLISGAAAYIPELYAYFTILPEYTGKPVGPVNEGLVALVGIFLIPVNLIAIRGAHCLVNATRKLAKAVYNKILLQKQLSRMEANIQRGVADV